MEPVFNFGKYKGESVISVIERDYNYCEWLLHQDKFMEKNEKLFTIMMKNGVKYDKDYNRRKEELKELKKTHFTFGKYNGQDIHNVYKKDARYCEYIIGLDNIAKYHKETVETIECLKNMY